ncbi:MAG: GNAT family N-acetyltransferase [Clostridiales bacterium]|nr:GNAT family N-acetyltransferase [Clostridiales bacterium]
MERIRKGLCGGDFLHCRKINEEQLVDLYEIHLNRDFPDNERKPLAMLLDQMRKGNYHVWGFYRKAEMVAYALFQQRPGSNCILLDYYAVLPQYRAGGVGSQCFQHFHFLMKDYDMILIETENPMQAETEEERIIQIRRQNFYKRNGAVLFPLYVTVCGAPFQLMAVSCRERPGKQVCQTEMDLLYRSLFSKERYEKQVFWQ